MTLRFELQDHASTRFDGLCKYDTALTLSKRVVVFIEYEKNDVYKEKKCWHTNGKQHILNPKPYNNGKQHIRERYQNTREQTMRRNDNGDTREKIWVESRYEIKMEIHDMRKVGQTDAYPQPGRRLQADPQPGRRLFSK